MLLNEIYELLFVLNSFSFSNTLPMFMYSNETFHCTDNYNFFSLMKQLSQADGKVEFRAMYCFSLFFNTSLHFKVID